MFAVTRGDYKYRHLSTSVPSVNQIVFSVKACKYVHILLGSIPGDVFNDAYEITIGMTIGQNTYTEIKYDIAGSRKVEAMTPDVLNCTSFNTFWVRWGYSNAGRTRVEVGTGTILGRDRLLYLIDRDNPREIVQAYFATGDGAVGYWEFIKYEGKRLGVVTIFIIGISILM